MDSPFLHIERCIDLQERDLVEAIATREKTKALIEWLSQVSAPDTGAAKVLLVVSRMATTACTWIDGDLCVDLVASAGKTVIEVATDLGGGLRERLFQPQSFRAPLAEFVRAIDRVPHLVAPLTIRARLPDRVSLSATDTARRATLPPAPIEIAAESLFEPAAPSPSLPPFDVESGWDD